MLVGVSCSGFCLETVLDEIDVISDYGVDQVSVQPGLWPMVELQNPGERLAAFRKLQQRFGSAGASQSELLSLRIGAPLERRVSLRRQRCSL